MTIPKNITAEHVYKALDYIQNNGIPTSREATKYALLFNEKRFPPKYVVSIANIYANGEEHNPRLFSGGKETNDYLNKLGFEIIRLNNTWIFQGNPDKFDLNNYLLDNQVIWWSVRQEHYAKDMQINDEVYIWRADGSAKGTGGIIAKCKIVDVPQERQNDEDSHSYWFTDDWKTPYLAVQLSVIGVKIDEDKGYISRVFLNSHPILCNLRILKVRTNTNYLLSDEHTILIDELWDNTDIEISKLDDIDSTTLTDTEKTQITKTRIGQSIFKRKLITAYKKCCLCNLTDSRFLIASHIKPWNKSDNYERLDYNNGLLLCPNHDALFDKGFITFNDKGKILISSSIDENTMRFMNIHLHMRIEMNEKRLKYIQWHRENIFIG